MLRLPPDLRGELKEPMGPVYDDPAALLADAGEPVVAVGDVVAHHLFEAGHEPRVAVVDGLTERATAPESVRSSLPPADRTVTNEAGTLSRDLLVALRDAVRGEGPTVVGVDGEEDLAAVPALLVTPLGGSVVYGQPGEGMVLVRVDEAARDRARDLLGRMDGDAAVALALLDAA
ncbi:MAG: GTP-dependent dephospho-CoA kinase family protein [Haloferacaceae archaeon]